MNFIRMHELQEVKKEADWRLKKQQVFTDIYNGENGVEVGMIFNKKRDAFIHLCY